MRANRTHCGMKEKTDVADGQRGDLADFLVAEVALELQMDNLTLILRQVFDDLEYLADRSAFVKVGQDRDFRVP